MNEELKKEWEKEFDKEFGDCQDYDPQTFKDFISSLLAKQQAEFDKTLNSGRKMYELGKAETLSQIKGIGCEEGIDIVTVAKIINRLNEKS